jgi:hypothetical protein
MMSSDDAFGELEESFFATGDAANAAEQYKQAWREADGIAQVIEDERPARLLAMQAWLRPRLVGAGNWLLWRARLLQFRVAVAVYQRTEHVRRVVVEHAFSPSVATRNPRLVRAIIVILICTVANFSAAAVLAAAGAL